MKRFLLDIQGSILSIEYLILAGLISFGTLSFGKYLNDAKEEYLQSYLSDFNYKSIKNDVRSSINSTKINSSNSFEKESFFTQQAICP